MSIVDVLSLVAPDQGWAMTHYLNNTTPGGNPTITYIGPPNDDGQQDLVYVKGLVGYPWDWMTLGQSWIRQRLTENIWSDPSSGKLECISGLGVRRLPRWIIRGAGDSLSLYQWTMTRPETDYWIIPAGAQSATRNTDSGVRCTFRGPYKGMAIGDLPAGEDWIEDYEWAGKVNAAGQTIYGNLERVTHRKGFGRYSWQLFAPDGTGSVQDPVTGKGYMTVPSKFNQSTNIVPLTSPVVPVQKIW